MSDQAQSFENHAKLVTGYHRVATGLLFIPFFWMAYRTVTTFSLDQLMTLLFWLGVIVVAFFARVFPLGVQDRVIRLEERLRLRELLPDDLRGRIEELSTKQLVGLRFASDDELPDLARRVLDGEVTERDDIKRAVKSWRADHQRI